MMPLLQPWHESQAIQGWATDFLYPSGGELCLSADVIEKFWFESVVRLLRISFIAVILGTVYPIEE